MLIVQDSWIWSVWPWHYYLNACPNFSETTAITKNTASDYMLLSPCCLVKVYLHAYAAEVVYIYKENTFL